MLISDKLILDAGKGHELKFTANFVNGAMTYMTETLHSLSLWGQNYVSSWR